MKTLLPILALMVVSLGYSQNSKYKYYDDNHKVVDKEDATFYRIIKTNSKGDYHGEIRDFYMTDTLKNSTNYNNGLREGLSISYFKNGKKRSESMYVGGLQKGSHISYYQNGGIKTQEKYEIHKVPDDGGRRSIFQLVHGWDSLGIQQVIDGDGYFSYYHSNGEIDSRGKYKNGVKDSTWIGYKNTGRLYYKEKYSKGKLVNGNSYDSLGAEYFYEENIDKGTQPKNGMRTFYKHVQKVMRYPAYARRRGIQGRVFVEFVVDKEGVPTKVKVIKGIGGGCDKEAVEAVRSFKKWIPGLQRGQKIKQKIVLPITFRLG